MAGSSPASTAAAGFRGFPILASHWDGKKLNSPNDIVIHSSGAIFFTDPTYGMDTGRVPAFGSPGQSPELNFQGVYRIDADGSLHLVVPEGFTQPNGLAFSPDESLLYIGDSQERLIWRYEVNRDLTLGARTLFVDQRGDSRRGAPDGMKVDTEGRLWTTGAGGVSVHTPEGKYLGVFESPEHAANLTFGGPDFSTLFLTTGTSVHAVETTVRGLVPGSR
jgi:gluconolactonase